MNKNLAVGVGVLMALMGSIFTLQGLGVLAGSGMTGKTLWAIIGPILALIGLAVVVGAIRSGRAEQP
jgi:hypothetical protein